MAYASGVVSVGTTATLICTPGPGGASVQNLSANAVTLGGPGVAVGSGVTLPASMTSPVLVATGMELGTVGEDNGLYGRVAAGTNSVAFLTAA